MHGDNQDLVQKTITTNDMLYGGRLNPVQQDAFVQLVKDNATLLPQTRFVSMATSRKLVDKLYIGEPVTRKAPQNTNQGTDSRTVFDQVPLNAEKVRSDWALTTETLQENIEGDNFEDTVMEMMSKRIATDMELLAIQGDTSLAGGTPLNDLLNTFDGYDLLTEGAQIVDAGGSTIDKSIWAAAMRAMPEQYLQDPDLRWICSRSIAIDWAEEVSDRETAAGDSALAGSTLAPLGIPMLVVPNMPSRKPVPVTTATPAVLLAGEFGPYEIITGTNDVLNIGLDGAVVQAAANYTIPAGVYTVSELIAALRTLFAATNLASGLKMYDDGTGRLVIESTATGAFATGATGARIIIGSGSANAELGFTDSTNYDSAAAGSGTVLEGTIIWLANPKNFLFGMVDDTRIYSEFNKDYDRYEFVVYNQAAVNIENLEAIVKITNLRRG